jgi:prevent-host-death family protein
MAEKISAKDARSRFAELLGRVGFGREEIVINRSGKPMAAMIPVDVYERLVSERAARFAILRDIQENQPDLSPEQVEADVAALLDQVRAARASGGH